MSKYLLSINLNMIVDCTTSRININNQIKIQKNYLIILIYMNKQILLDHNNCDLRDSYKGLKVIKFHLKTFVQTRNKYFETNSLI